MEPFREFTVTSLVSSNFAAIQEVKPPADCWRFLITTHWIEYEKVATTLGIYAHLSAKGKEEAAQTMGGMLEIRVV